MYAPGETNLIRKRFHQAILDGKMSRQEVNIAMEALGLKYNPPIKVSAEGYLFNQGSTRLSICQEPFGTRETQREGDKYVDKWLQDQIVEQHGHGWGGTRVKVTIEEVL